MGLGEELNFLKHFYIWNQYDELKIQFYYLKTFRQSLARMSIFRTSYSNAEVRNLRSLCNYGILGALTYSQVNIYALIL